MNRRLWIAALLLVAFFVALVLRTGVRRTSSAAASREAGAPGAWQSATTRAIAPGAESVPGAAGQPMVAMPELPELTEGYVRQLSVEKAQKSLALYKETMVYPPWSRPFDGSTKHLADWNKPWPAGQPFAADQNKREIRADLSLDKLFAGPGETLSATLAIAYVDDRTAVDVEEMAGRVEWLDLGTNQWQLGDTVSFTRAGDRYVASFVPSQIAALTQSPRVARLAAFVRIGEFPKLLSQGFQYASRSPFVVRGLAGDRVTTDGSLEVLLDVDVRYLAPTLVQAVLYDARGQTGIAVFDDYIRPKALGRQQVALRFFGKTLRDRGINGPYRIRALHGHVKVPEQIPPEVFWAQPDEPPMLTRAWSSNQFSGGAWSDPEKEAKIAQYQGLIGELSAGH